MKALPLAALIFGVVVLVGCDPGIDIQIENDTNVPLCVSSRSAHPVPPDPARACEDGEIAPSESIGWGVICVPKDVVRLVIRRKDTAEVVHSSDATCGQWDDSGAQITVVEVDGRIVARASLEEDQ